MPRPRIVVLDGHTTTSLGPGEPTWDELGALGELTVHARTPPDQVVDRSRGAAVVITNKSLLPAEAFDGLPGLALVSVLATGTNVVDLAAARRAGVTVCNVPGYGTDSVAQHVFGLLLGLVQHVADHDRAVHEGAWSRSPDFCFTVAPMTELAGKTLGIVGLGAIGRRVGEIGHALGMQIAATTRTERATSFPVRFWAVDELFAVADVVTLHCPLTDATHGLVSAARLARMKPSALIINTGRGPLVDEAALARALDAGRIAGAALDVLSVEPPPADHPLLGAPHCIITPHVAWATREARARLMAVTVENVRRFLEGRPINVVSSA
jgi:glycerate dehydrogenase